MKQRLDDKLYLRQGTSTDGAFSLVVTPEQAGWTYSGLKVLTLPPGGSHTWATGQDEILVLPLSGSATVTVTSRDGGAFAIPSARCTRRLEPRYGPAEDVPVELRGAGQASRQVNNFCSPGAFECDKLIAVEVLTPGGNWSSYPPHKHDETSEDEAELEEIYYFETEGLAYQRVYGTPDRPVDVLAEVGTGDVVLIPHGWHGPSIAAPGYALYYLNVMAGPEPTRSWRFCDDPAHAWIRGTWADQQIDSRLPLTSATENTG